MFLGSVEAFHICLLLSFSLCFTYSQQPIPNKASPINIVFVPFVRRQKESEIVTEKQPIKTTFEPALTVREHFQTVALFHKSRWLIDTRAYYEAAEKRQTKAFLK